MTTFEALSLLSVPLAALALAFGSLWLTRKVRDS